MAEDPQLSEDEQCELLAAFGKIACAGSQSLHPTSDDEKVWQNFTCTVCDATASRDHDAPTHWNNDTSNEVWKDAIGAMIAITNEERFDKSSKPRVLMAVAIQRVFTHISDPDYLNLEISPLGKWLINAMTRSMRELRITASRALMTFLGDDVTDTVRAKNRRGMIQFLVELTKRNVPSVQETLIIAYGLAARTCSEVELEIILGQLVDYLGHTNTVIYGAAFNELLSLADDLHKSPLEMLRPYWRTIGFKVVNEIYNKPQKAQFVGNLTGLTVSSLLLEIHGHVLPILVLNKRKDVIERIAQAKDTTPEDVCIEPRHHLCRILALLLCQPGNDVERRAMDSLISVAPGFKENRFELHELVLMESAGAAFEVLKMAADHDDGDKRVVCIRLQVVHIEADLDSSTMGSNVSPH
jgi:serine/threonine-protein kinase ATR